MYYNLMWHRAQESIGQWLENHDLEKLYGHCDIPAHQWSLVTNLLEKLAIVTAACP